MIKINIDSEKLIEIKDRHLNYAIKFVLPNLKNKINSIDVKVNKDEKEYFQLLEKHFNTLICGELREIKIILGIECPVTNVEKELNSIVKLYDKAYADDLEQIFNYSNESKGSFYSPKFIDGKNVKINDLNGGLIGVNNLIEDTRYNMKKYYDQVRYIEDIISIINPNWQLTRKEVSGLKEFKRMVYSELYNLKGRKATTKGLRQTIREKFRHLFIDKWGAYELVSELGVRVCPYCNRQFISILNVKSGKTRPELDHFYPKSEYPFFALSLFNLIPSCHVCNSNFKGKKNTSGLGHTIKECLNPYDRGFENELVFKIEGVKDNLDYLIDNNLDFQIKLEKNQNINLDADIVNKAEENKCLFHLEELYNQNHKDYVQELIWKRRVYNEGYIQELIDDWRGLFENEDEIKRLIVGNYTEIDDYSKRVLAKFTKDIAIDLGILDLFC